MKRLFATAFVLLLVASTVTWRMRPEVQSDKPILYWTTGNDRLRQQQIALFEDWLEEKGYPPVEVRIDNANRDISKRLIQGVSGVAADLIDCYNSQMELFESVGMLANLTGPAQEFGFTAEKTYEALQDDLMVDGEQYGFPLNVSVILYWVNLDMFREAGMEPPPRSWDLDTFEQWGLRYLERMKRKDPAGKYFFASGAMRSVLARSHGAFLYNETLTGSRLATQPYYDTLKTFNRWVNEYHLIPTAEEEDSFAIEASGRDARIALFVRGNYALLASGRFALNTMREHGTVNLSVSHFPYDHFENTLITSTILSLSKNSRNKEHAYHFLEYLTSAPYNLKMAEEGGSLPAVPEFTRSPVFLKPEKYPNEWGCHERFIEAAESIAIGRLASPFILNEVAERIEILAYQSFMAGRLTAEEAGRIAQDRIDAQIALNLADNPDLLPEYKRRVAIQKKIDHRLREGLSIPVEWIDNAYYRKYYRAMGLLEEN